MEIVKADKLIIWLVLLLIGVAMIVGPVIAVNETGYKKYNLYNFKSMDSGTLIKTKTTGEDKDKNVMDTDNDKKDKLDKDDKNKDSDNEVDDDSGNSDNGGITIKSHPVLK